MLIENLTPEEYEALKKAVGDKLGNHQDNSYRYINIGNYDHYPYQASFDVVKSLAKKLGIRT